MGYTITWNSRRKWCQMGNMPSTILKYFFVSNFFFLVIFFFIRQNTQTEVKMLVLMKLFFVRKQRNEKKKNVGFDWSAIVKRLKGNVNWNATENSFFLTAVLGCATRRTTMMRSRDGMKGEKNARKHIHTFVERSSIGLHANGNANLKMRTVDEFFFFFKSHRNEKGTQSTVKSWN